jgi:hypothetical protein
MQEGIFQKGRELLFFWAFGDLPFFSQPDWTQVHARRLKEMFEDLHQLWQEMGSPAFCVSPGAIVETYAQENCAFAYARLKDELGTIPFYPGSRIYFASKQWLDRRKCEQAQTSANE